MKKSSKAVRQPRLHSIVRSRKPVFMHEQPYAISANSSTPPPPPPAEDFVVKLNEIGKEYPFCVWYHEKSHDPL